MTALPFKTAAQRRAQLGLVALQADETLEDELRALLPANVSLLVSRVPSGPTVTRESLSEMQKHLHAAADLFPAGKSFDVIGYGCTSGTAEIGADRIAASLRAARPAQAVTDPCTALIAACTALGITKLAILSPYIAPVSDQLRRVLAAEGIETPVFGSFEEANEATVAAIDPDSTKAAALHMMEHASGVDGLFLSCTNLVTLPILTALQTRLGIPVLSSNLVLAWDMLREAGALPRPDSLPADLLAKDHAAD